MAESLQRQTGGSPRARVKVSKGGFRSAGPALPARPDHRSHSVTGDQPSRVRAAAVRLTWLAVAVRHWRRSCLGPLGVSSAGHPALL